MAPASTLPPILTHISTVYHNYIHPFLPSPIQTLFNNLTPIATNLVTSATNGDLTSLISTLVIVYLSLRIADYIRRSVIAWFLFIFKILLVIALVNAAVYVNRVGVGKAMEDAEWLWDLIWGFVEHRVAMAGNGNDSNSGYFGGPGNQWNFNGGVGGGARRQQQVPIGKRATKRRSGGWS